MNRPLQFSLLFLISTCISVAQVRDSSNKDISLPASALIPINISVSPTGARVSIDGYFRGIGTIHQVALGKHIIKIEANEFKTIETSIEVNNTNTFFRYTLEQIRATYVKILTVPNRASLYLNNILVAETNTEFYKAPGLYDLHIEKEGYKSVDTVLLFMKNTQNVYVFEMTPITESHLKSISVLEATNPTPALKNELREKGAAIVSFSVTPADAVLYLDNIKTASTVFELTAGAHVVSISKPGYVLLKDTLHLNPGNFEEKNYSLKNCTGLVDFEIEPSDAKVVINKENYTGKNVAELGPGKYMIEIAKEGYYPHSDVIEISEGQTLVKKYQLKQRVGILQIRVLPAATEITLSGSHIEAIQWTGTTCLSNIAPGAYKMHCQLAEYENFDTTIMIMENSVTETEIQMKPGKHSLRAYKTTEWLYSGVVPGMGQYMQGRKIIGAVSFLAEAGGCLYWYFSAKSYNSAVDEYNRSNLIYKANPIDENRFIALNDRTKAKSLYKKNNTAIVLSGVIYLANVIDAFIAQPVLYEERVQLYPGVRQAEYGITYSLEVKVIL